MDKHRDGTIFTSTHRDDPTHRPKNRQEQTKLTFTEEEKAQFEKWNASSLKHYGRQPVSSLERPQSFKSSCSGKGVDRLINSFEGKAEKQINAYGGARPKDRKHSSTEPNPNAKPTIPKKPIVYRDKKVSESKLDLGEFDAVGRAMDKHRVGTIFTSCTHRDDPTHRPKNRQEQTKLTFTEEEKTQFEKWNASSLKHYGRQPVSSLERPQSSKSSCSGKGVDRLINSFEGKTEKQINAYGGARPKDRKHSSTEPNPNAKPTIPKKPIVYRDKKVSESKLDLGEFDAVARAFLEEIGLKDRTSTENIFQKKPPIRMKKSQSLKTLSTGTERQTSDSSKSGKENERGTFLERDYQKQGNFSKPKRPIYPKPLNPPIPQKPSKTQDEASERSTESLAKREMTEGTLETNSLQSKRRSSRKSPRPFICRSSSNKRSFLKDQSTDSPATDHADLKKSGSCSSVYTTRSESSRGSRENISERDSNRRRGRHSSEKKIDAEVMDTGNFFENWPRTGKTIPDSLSKHDTKASTADSACKESQHSKTKNDLHTASSNDFNSSHGAKAKTKTKTRILPDNRTDKPDMVQSNQTPAKTSPNRHSTGTGHAETSLNFSKKSLRSQNNSLLSNDESASIHRSGITNQGLREVDLHSNPRGSLTFYLLLVREDEEPSLFDILEKILDSSERTLRSGIMNKTVGIESASLIFPDTYKAEKAFQLLIQHGGADIKLLCSWFTLENRIERLTKYWQDTDMYPRETLKKHHDKINQVKKLIKTCLEDEHEALELRKSELLQQMLEFRKYQSTVRKTLQKLAIEVNETKFYSAIESLMTNFGVECSRLESALPIYARRSDILKIVKDNQIVIVRGETGSGKSTQLVQYLYESGLYTSGLIACSQPRKVACISLGERVAGELITAVGRVVGIKAGMNNRTTRDTQIVYTTHHTLLNECLSDPLFSRYSVLMIDEVHERSIFTDILLSILKNCLPRRPDLKVLIASATIDVQVFTDYFPGAPVLEVSGRAFPVEIIWQPHYHQWTDTVQEIVSKTIEVHRSEDLGDILAFVTTGMETEKCKDAFENAMANWNNYECMMLHGQLPPEEQKLIFKQLKDGQRKIIFATNSAETSLTIPGIKYVIDSGLVKEKLFDSRKNMNTLVVVPISRSSADQRKGRAGRTAPGKCFRLYTESDYKEMKASGTPEILRVHLSQTLLMLYEMKLTPKDCEFVESPSEAAIKTALQTLEELGCVKKDTITETGKWLVKIPLEPRFACMIKKGHEMGFVYDTIVFTALCSSSGSIFYRGGNEKQQKRSDLRKLKFCDPKGDAFTFLKIYKEWQAIPENRKNKWCFDNSINSKSLRGARDLVKEICDIFKQTWSIRVTQTFSEEPELEEALQKIILFSFYENIAHYLGHVRMGYYIPNLNQRVFVHPSSALKSLNDSSPWLVFINILKTSRDYITIVTPVEESWIRWITLEKTNQFNIDEAKSRSICSVRKEFFGATTFSFFVGPGYTKLRTYENQLYDAVHTPVVVEANRDSGEVKFICAFNPELPDSLITEWIDGARSHVIQRTMEYKVGTNTQAGGVRIVLGLGGEGQFILMPDEYRSVHIKKWDRNETTVESIQEKFGVFGKIVDCWQDKRSYHRWGRVTFSTAESAAEAVRRTQNDSVDAADPEFKIHKNASYQFQATIAWLRRKPTGLVFVEMDVLEAQSAVSLRQINILGIPCQMSIDKKTRRSVLIHKVPQDVTEQDIIYSFPSRDIRNSITKITIVREKVKTEQFEVDRYRHEIIEEFRDFDQSMNFAVDVMKPYESNVEFRAFIKFQDAIQGMAACDALRGRLVLNRQRAKITPKLSTSLTVTERVYTLLEEEVEEYIRDSRDSSKDFRVEIKNFGNERKILNISADNSTVLVRIRAGLAAILQGEVRECWRNENYRHLFLKSGKEFLRGLEKQTDTIVQLDERLFTIRIYGKERNITNAQSRINTYLNDILEGDGNREVKLNGEAQPKGLMKTLVTRYDLELERLVQEAGLRSALLNHHTQTLKISGSSESLEKASKLIESICEELRGQDSTKSTVEEEIPDCCVCFCPVDDPLYRLEYCGHVYCLDCLKRQITVAIQSKELPVTCGECQHPLVWADFQFCFKRLQINPLSLVTSAVSVYMSKNKDGYRHCLTPDCPMVYRVTEKSDIFSCGECGVRICTACHIEYHDGLTCAMMKSGSESDLEMEKYLRDHAQTVKKCPNCSTPIEKKSGCNHMTCTGCKIHFCWLCCKHFKSTTETYAHLNREHHGIFDY